MLNTVPGTSAAVAWRRPARQRSNLDAALRHIETRYTKRLTLDELAGLAGLSVFRFVTVFRRHLGISPYRYICAARVHAAQDLLRAGVPPAIAAIEVGFCDQSHLCRHFRSVCGMTPGQFLARIANHGDA